MNRRKIIFVSDFPNLVSEWDFSVNAEDPSSVPFGTSRKVGWVCSKGHKWVDTVYHRTKENRNCPFCNNSRVWPGFNDIATTNPEIMDEWDGEVNEVSPDLVLFRSSKEYFWKCRKCGSTFKCSPSKRHGGKNCPFCGRKRCVKDENDLETLFPKIAKEWDYGKNSNITPSDVSAHSDDCFFWKCSNGHSWLASVANRTSKYSPTGCPICSNKRIVPNVNDLASTNPEVLKMWDYNKNKIRPTEISAGSNRNVFWVCKNGHSFSTKVYLVVDSKNKNNCPYCRNFSISVGENDLASTHPYLLDEWDYEGNRLKPTEVHAGSRREAVWVCKKGHKWNATIQSRTRNKSGCPICLNQKVQPGFNDVGTLYPEIKKYWDYEKNDKKPEDFAGIKSNKRVWFICEKKHSWITGIQDFTSGTRCPFCGNKKTLYGFNDLFTTNPTLKEEWDFDKNIIDPKAITFGCDKKAWWKCKKGHSWSASINSRVNGRGCPRCAKETQTSLPEKTIFYYVKKSFPDTVENARLSELKGKEIDVFIPSLKIGIEYDGYNWHKDSKRDETKDFLCERAGIHLIRIREDGCAPMGGTSFKIAAPRIHSNISLMKEPLKEMFSLIGVIAKKEISIDVLPGRDLPLIYELLATYEKENSLAVISPSIANEWNFKRNGSLSPQLVSVHSNKRVWWRCQNGHEWQAIVNSRTRPNGCGCPICGGKKVLKGFNDLSTTHPELSSEWNSEMNVGQCPDQVTQFSSKKKWWRCKYGHEWQATISSRTRKNGSGCPYCAGKKAVIGQNDLNTIRPDIVETWDCKKNLPLTPLDVTVGSEKVVWWRCQNGHEWQSSVYLRSKLKNNCPICYAAKKLKRVICIETGIVYSCANEASNKTGLKKHGIRHACYSGYQCGGLHWKYLDK